MIDTIRLRTTMPYEQAKLVRSSIKVTQKLDQKTNEIDWIFHKDSLNIGSYSRGVNLYMPNGSDQLYIEFSLPKMKYGHNVQMMYNDEIEDTIKSVYASLSETLTLPHYSKWEVMRFDACYNYKFIDYKHLSADDVLSVLKLLDYPRKQKYVYDTSVMYTGRTFSLKFYLKHPEYATHDYNALLDINKNVAYQAYETSKHMLRFEITLRKQYLLKYYKKRVILIQDIIKTDIKKLLNSYLIEFNKYLTIDVMSDKDILTTLQTKYSTTKASRLYLFYKQYYSDNPIEQQVIQQLYSRTTIYRYTKDLKESNITTQSIHVKPGIKIDLSLLTIE